MIAALVFVLCGTASFACAMLFLRQYASARTPLLLFSAFAFLGLGINNVLVYVDLVLLPDVDLAFWRKIPSVIGMALLLYGLIRERG